MKQRVLVCGGRDYSCREQLFAVLDHAHAANPILVLIHGAARGADMLADAWARNRGVAVNLFPADWETHGKAAGPMRNRRMLAEGLPDIVIAFKGGRGTADMVRLARNAGIPVATVRAPNGTLAASSGTEEHNTTERLS